MTSSTSSTHPIMATPVPVGAVIAYAGYKANSQSQPTANVESQGWMVCDGRLLNCSLYPQLFAVIGFQYSQPGDSYESGYTGQLNNDAMFRIPDYRGDFWRMEKGSHVGPDINSLTSTPTGETPPTGIVNQSQVTQCKNTTMDYIIKFA